MKKRAKSKKVNWKKKAWTEISRFVRFSDLDEDGLATCYTCGCKLEPKNANAGHFKHNRLDWDMMNVKVQCVRCNLRLHGNLGEYAIRLIKDYGQEAVDDLIIRANKCEPIDWESIYYKFKELNDQNIQM